MMAVLLPKGGQVPATRLSKAGQQVYARRAASGMPIDHSAAGRDCIRTHPPKNGSGVLDADSKYYFWNLLFHVRMMRFLFSPAQTALYLISFGMILTFPETPGRVTLERV